MRLRSGIITEKSGNPRGSTWNRVKRGRGFPGSQRGVLAGLILCAIVLLGQTHTGGASPKDPCDAMGTLLLVDTRDNVLWKCQEGNNVGQYSIALGRGGVGKHAQGDGKTPVGEYMVGKPRVSERYGLFIPVGYPTVEQRKRGYSGADIGIHGPPRALKWLGSLTTWFNWTRGCIAVGGDDEIKDIARWVQENGVNRIRIIGKTEEEHSGTLMH